MATGWLGWMPEVAWRTPIPELLLAMDARVEWTRMTHPFGGGTAEPEKPKASTVAAKLRAVLTGRRQGD